MQIIKALPLTKEAFAPFGDVIEISTAEKSHFINRGTTERFHNLTSAVAFGEDGHVIISMARAQPFAPPIFLTKMERHPLGSQAFIPVSPTRFLITTAPDENGKPGTPLAFLAAPGQGINYFRNTWHGVLTVLESVSDFLIIDREGEGKNLEEHQFTQAYQIEI